jgi:hypothetical protein
MLTRINGRGGDIFGIEEMYLECRSCIWNGAAN